MTTFLDPLLKKQLERDEGRSLTAYQDSAGYWTIGVGHLLGTEKRMSIITDAECDALLEADVEEASDALIDVFGVSFRAGPARWRAMLNMAFNRGEKHMRESTTITPAIKAALAGSGEWKAVSDAILASPWGKQIKSRAVRLAKQFETGIDQ